MCVEQQHARVWKLESRLNATARSSCPPALRQGKIPVRLGRAEGVRRDVPSHTYVTWPTHGGPTGALTSAPTCRFGEEPKAGRQERCCSLRLAWRRTCARSQSRGEGGGRRGQGSARGWVARCLLPAALSGPPFWWCLHLVRARAGDASPVGGPGHDDFHRPNCKGDRGGVRPRLVQQPLVAEHVQRLRVHVQGIPAAAAGRAGSCQSLVLVPHTHTPALRLCVCWTRTWSAAG